MTLQVLYGAEIIRITENYQKYQTTQALDRTLDLSVYLEGLDDSPESKQIAQARGICAQTLRTAGYSFLQINLLHPFIMQNKSVAVSILDWCHSGFSLKKIREIIVIINTHFVRNFDCR